MARNHVCTGSDHISKLAADAGFEHWNTVWDENGSLKSKRANPNLLFKGDKLHPQGDTVKIPEHDPGSTSAAVDAHHPFTIGSDHLFLRLRILKDDFTALANAQYTLTVDGVVAPFTGKTNGQGQLEKEIPRTATQGTLTVTASAPASGSGGSGSGGGTCAEAPVTWQLQIGRLNPIMENAPDLWCIAGVQQRLNNLGISTGPIDGIKGRLTEAAIKTFQRLFDLQDDGKPGQGETQPKLQEVHDKPDSVLGPKPPPNDSQWADTPDDAHGHVCPDFDDRKVFNTLRLRSTYRLTLRLGAFEELFPHAPNTVEGRMERMQLLGLYYYPLKHRRALQAFNGISASGTAPAVRGIWDYFKTRVLNGADDAAADQELQRMLREWIVAGGNLPPAVDSSSTPTAANLAKLRLPGGYSFLTSDEPPCLNLNADPNYTELTFGRNLYTAESKYRRDNPVLGQVPLVAKVEKFDMTSCEWHAAPEATVYVQLVDPYALPAFDPSQPVTQQLNHPALRTTSIGPPAAASGAGPNRLVSREENPSGPLAPSPTDPQRGNCPHGRGGNQGQGNLTDGSDVAGVIFSTGSVPGFNAAHSAPSKGTVNPITRTVFFPVAERVNDSQRPHCVKAKSNSQGEAGVIFTPSRCGGDRYRLRAFLGPPTFNGPGSDGTGAAAVSVETGTFVLWRHLRISRYVQQPLASPDPALLADAVANAVGIANNNDYLRRAYVVDAAGVNRGLPTADFSSSFSSVAFYDSLPVQWARAFVEVEIDRAAQAALPETLTQAEWQAARQQALADGGDGMVALGLNIDLRRLLFLDPAAPASLDVNSAVVNLPMRSRLGYNALVPVARRIAQAGGGNNVAKVTTLFWNYLAPGFLRALTSNGYACGLTVVQGAYGCSWQLYRDIADNSGIALEYRGAFVWAGADFYPGSPQVPAPTRPPWGAYDYTSNTCHEMGHCCYRTHARGKDPDNGEGGGANAANHDPVTGNRSLCVMSYQTNEGQFCGKCLLSFRGWNLAQIPS